MKITDFLREDKIFLELTASDKEEAVKKLSDILKGSVEVSDPGLFIKDVFDREALSTTGIGNGIAIPHARTDAVKEFVIAFGRANQGIEFDSLDKKPAKLIFLMGTPKKKDLSNYLRILADLTRLLNKKHFREALLKASSPEKVIEAFKKGES